MWLSGSQKGCRQDSLPRKTSLFTLKRHLAFAWTYTCTGPQQGSSFSLTCCYKYKHYRTQTWTREITLFELKFGKCLTSLRLKKDKCPIMPLPLSISYRGGKPSWDSVPPQDQDSAASWQGRRNWGQTWMMMLPEDQMGDTESPANMTCRNDCPHS